MKYKIIILLTCVIFICACFNKEKYSKKAFLSLGTVVEVTLPSQFSERYMKKVEFLFDLYHETISNDLYDLNGKYEYVEISEVTYSLLKREMIYRNLSPYFNSSVHTISRLYGFPEPKSPYIEPDEKEVIEAKKVYFNSKFNIKSEIVDGVPLYYVNPNGLWFDFGSFAKGLIVDRAADMLHKSGINNFIIAAGGDIYADQEKSNDNPWRIGIVDPLSKGNISVVNLKNKSVATSGSYERFFVKADGTIISHFFNAMDAEPVLNYKSVSVIDSNCERADLLATILFITPFEEIPIACEKFNVPVLIMDHDAKLHRFCKWEDYE